MSALPTCLRFTRFLIDKPSVSSNILRSPSGGFPISNSLWQKMSAHRFSPAFSSTTASSDTKPQEPLAPGEKPPEPATPTHNPQLEELNQRLEELAKQKDDLNDKYKRALAESENMRVRLTKQIEDAKIYGIQSFCKDLLDVADVLSKATESVPKEEIKESNPHLKNLFEGLTMTEAQLLKVFERHGLKAVDPLNEKFNPNLHEALFQQEVEGKEPGTIVVVSKIGYKLYDRILRPALVGVAK